MSIADELQKLDKLRREGTLTDEEFEVAKSKILEAPNSAIDFDHLSEIKSQNDVAQLDREWTIERENYMISGQNGLRQIPTRTTSLIGGILIVSFGLFWTITAGSMTGGLFPLIGVIFIIFGAGMSIYTYGKAVDYEYAQTKYKQRRQELLDKNGRGN